MNRGHLGSRRQVVSFRLAKNQKKRMCSANARPMGIVDARILVATPVQFLQTPAGLLLQLIEFAKVNRLRRAGFRAGRKSSLQVGDRSKMYT